MTLLLNLDEFSAPPQRDVASWWLNERPAVERTNGGIWTIRDEISPADLYTYLYAKFGPPNGPMNILREDDSDNLIHWDWFLRHDHGLLMFLGMNLRSEVHVQGRWPFAKLDRNQLIRFILADRSRYHNAISKIEHEILEDWETFLNPYHNLSASMSDMRRQLAELELDHDRDEFSNPESSVEIEKLQETIARLSDRYVRAYGLTYALRTLAPVLAESFVNLLMFILLKDDIKGDKRLRNAANRAHIDIKVKSLHINCIGFARKVDWDSPACVAYRKVIDDRNDVLHGNVVVNKLKTGEVYFNGKVPVFKKCTSFWSQTFATSLQACGYAHVQSHLTAVDNFIKYVLDCLDIGVRLQINHLIKAKELGLNKRTGRVGVLFPGHVVDIQLKGLIKP